MGEVPSLFDHGFRRLSFVVKEFYGNDDSVTVRPNRLLSIEREVMVSTMGRQNSKAAFSWSRFTCQERHPDVGGLTVAIIDSSTTTMRVVDNVSKSVATGRLNHGPATLQE